MSVAAIVLNPGIEVTEDPIPRERFLQNRGCIADD
jgi:hypothetical protein